MANEPGNRSGGPHEPGLRLVDTEGQPDHRRLAREIHESTDPLLEDIERQLARLRDMGHPGSEDIIEQCRETIYEIRTLMSALCADESTTTGG